MTYEIERNGQRLSRQVTVGALLHHRHQWFGVGTRVILVFALFLGIPALVYKWRPHDPRALLFMLFANTFGLSMLNFAVPGAGQPPESIIPMPDAYIRVNAAGVLLTYICALVVSPTLFHFLTLFPQPRLEPQSLARLLRWTYLVPAMVAWVASPVALLLLSRYVTSPARLWVNLALAALAAVAAVVLWWTRQRGHAWRARLRDAPAVPVAVVALAYTAAILALFVIVNLRSRPLADLVGGLLMVAAIALFSLCIGVAYPVASAVAMWRSWRLEFGRGATADPLATPQHHLGPGDRGGAVGAVVHAVAHHQQRATARRSTRCSRPRRGWPTRSSRWHSPPRCCATG